MTTITEEEYTKNVLARCSNEFHAEMVPENMMIQLVTETLNNSFRMDCAKKGLFYGKYPSEDNGTFADVASQHRELSEEAGIKNCGWPELSVEEQQLLHALLGITSELNEAWLAFGKLMNQRRREQGMLSNDDVFDRVNMLEEFGDIMWYLTLGINACGSTLAAERERNDKKLEKRYGAVFSEEAANNRDLDGEREVLEG